MHFPLPPRLASPLSVGPRGSDSPEAFVFDHYGLFEGGARSPLPSSPALNPNLNPALSLGRAAQTGELADVRTRMLSIPVNIMTCGILEWGMTCSGDAHSTNG